MSTLDVAGVDYPVEFQGRRPLPIEGKSLTPVFRGRKREGHDLLAWNCGQGRAIMTGDWKLVRPTDARPWELYNLATDVGETTNLAGSFPNRVREMTAAYNAWRVRVGAK